MLQLLLRSPKLLFYNISVTASHVSVVFLGKSYQPKYIISRVIIMFRFVFFIEKKFLSHPIIFVTGFLNSFIHAPQSLKLMVSPAAGFDIGAEIAKEKVAKLKCMLDFKKNMVT
jgi:hypothetical protein